MRWVIFGAGAVGGVVGSRLFEAGHEVVLIARGAHRAAIARDGLLLRTPDGDRRHRIAVAGSAGEVDWRPDDAATLAMKSMDSATALADLSAHADPATTVLCLQNGVANERAALRLFENVYAVCVALPATHLEPGVVVQESAPVPGLLDLGRYPGSVDPTAGRLAAALRSAGFRAQARADIMRWKYAKLLMNLGNAVQALCGDLDGAEDITRVVREEGAAVLRAAGIDCATPAEDALRRGDTIQIQPVQGATRSGGSTWQSLARGARTVEADYLNGEVVLLGRLHGVPTPANEALRRLIARSARAGAGPGAVTPAQLLAALAPTGGSP